MMMMSMMFKKIKTAGLKHLWNYLHQSHYREVTLWEIFMEQELRFGLDLGRMADFPAFIASKSFDL